MERVFSCMNANVHLLHRGLKCFWTQGAVKWLFFTVNFFLNIQISKLRKNLLTEGPLE